MEQITKKLLNWASIIDEQTRNQAILTSSMPFIHGHVALMPDAHLGKGATVGSVIPTLGAIMPAAVGVDIGCGMIAVLTQFTESEFRGLLARELHLLSDLREGIEKAVPLSAGKYNHDLKRASVCRRIAELEGMAEAAGFNPDTYAPNWRYQVGTLGSGNHFIEVSVDEMDRVWLFLHSGSRGVGNKIAQHHIKVAQSVMSQYWIVLPDPDLAYLVEGTPEFDRYIAELRWAQHFALLNREEMMDRVVEQVSLFTGVPVQEFDRINCHHNFTEHEHHLGKDVWLSRKGAIAADAGRPGLIPGSMGTASYIVEGLGNRASFNSSPHGAGREYSRSAARRTFTKAALDEAMLGIEWSGSSAFLDEIPAAYKPIDQVMADAADLVEIKHTLRQIVNVKGD